jgi:hypothetical protein
MCPECKSYTFALSAASRVINKMVTIKGVYKLNFPNIEQKPTMPQKECERVKIW